MFAVFSFVGAKMQSLARVFASRVANDGGTTESLNCINPSYLLSQASFLQIPSGVKATVAYSELPTNGNGDLTWSRNSVANRTQSNGDIGSVAANVPRLDYSQGSCPALLLEPQRTNLALYSEQFDNATWGKSNVTVTANSTTAPDGNTTADTISITSNNGYIRLFPLTFVNSTTYTCSVFVKNNGISAGQTFNFYFNNNLGSTNAAEAKAIIDINAGSVTSQSVGSGISGVSSSITSLANAWYRVQLTFTLGASSGNTSAEIGFIAPTATRTFFAWGAQLEAGAYPTTYIPTTSATATRVADTFSRSNIYTNGLISASGGTWYVELKNNVAYTRDAAGNTISIGDSGTSNAIVIRNSSPSSNLRLQIVKSISASQTTLFTTVTDTVKIAIKWNGTSADVFVNGVKQVSATAFTTTIMEFLAASGQQVPTFIQAMALYPTPLSDGDCQTLTT